MNDPRIHQVFISIVRIINHICEKYRDKTSKSFNVIDRINSLVNKANREDALFELLNTPKDEVKIEIVDCLNNVPLNQFSLSEMRKMVKLLTVFNNSSGGKKEIVLAKLLWILSKIVKDYEIGTGKKFREKLSSAYIECIKILKNNQAILVTRKEEYEEKEFLSISCIHFLKCASMTREIEKDLAKSCENELGGILREDEKVIDRFSREVKHKKMKMYPIEIERTGLGSTVKNLLKVFKNTDGLRAYSKVCLRTFQAMADVVSGHFSCNAPNAFPGEPIDQEDINLETPPIDIIKRFLKNEKKTRTQKEMENWPELKEIELKSRESKKKTPQKHEELLDQIKQFVESNVFGDLLDYLLGLSNQNAERIQMMNYFKCIYQNKLENLSCINMLAVNGTNYLKEFCDSWRRAFEKVTESIKRQREEEKKKLEFEEDLRRKEKPTNLLMQELEKLPLSSLALTQSNEYENERRRMQMHIKRGNAAEIERKLAEANELPGSNSAMKALILQNETALIHYTLVKSEFKMREFKNMKTRTLVISSLMRAIFFSYAYNPEKRKEMLTALRSKHIVMKLTKLCCTTDWVTANIGAKYLRLVTLIVSMDSSRRM